MPDLILIILLTTLFGAFGQILIKIGMNNIGEVELKDVFGKKLFSILINPYILSGSILFFLSMLLWLFVLSKADLNFSYPFLSMGFILVMILSFLLLKESIPITRIVGIIIVLVGLFIIYYY